MLQVQAIIDHYKGRPLLSNFRTSFDIYACAALGYERNPTESYLKVDILYWRIGKKKMI
jgi:hypothetical protein